MDPAHVTTEQVASNRMESGMEPLMTADEVATALGVHRKFVYARAAAGALRGYKLGPHYRFRPEDVRAFLEARMAGRESLAEVRRPRRRSAPAGSFRALLDERSAA